jgi:hypothetical protein
MSADRPRPPLDPGEESIVHITGPLIELGERRAQRCVWCGADLLQPFPWRPSRLPPLAFAEGVLVRRTRQVDGGVQRVLGPLDPADPPLDLCAYAVPDGVPESGLGPG